MIVIRQTSDILGVLPERLVAALLPVLERDCDIYELRLVRERAVYLVTSDGIRFLQSNGSLSLSPQGGFVSLSADELEEIVRKAAGYSGFAHEVELRHSFLMRPDGTRIGIAAACAEGELPSGGIYSLNIRLPFCQNGIGISVIETILGDLTGGVLVAGAPGSGKTTLLRACCQYLGNGRGGVFRKVCVIDERGELAGEGGHFDLGTCTDVIAGRNKRDAILTAIRLMSPQIVVCDEIGSERESESILEGLNSGVVFLASMHANDMQQLIRRRQFLRLFSECVFERVVLLDPLRKGAVRSVYSFEEVDDEIHRSRGALLRGTFDCLHYKPEQEQAGCVAAETF